MCTPPDGMDSMRQMLTSRYCSRAPVLMGRRYSPSVMCAACCKKAESPVPIIQVSITTPCLCTCTIAMVTNDIKDSAIMTMLPTMIVITITKED